MRPPLAERIFESFSEGCAEVIDRGFYDQKDTQSIKGLRRDTEAMTDKFEEAISLLESKYKGKGKQKELKKGESNWPIIKDRRTRTIQLTKEAFTAIEEFRNKQKSEHRDRNKSKKR